MTVKTSFMPQLAINSGITDVSFYCRALGAKEVERVENEDGTLHVVIFAIDEATFLLHEVTEWSGTHLPDSERGGTVTVGLFTEDVHAVFNQAIEAGAISVSPVTDHEYGFRQGSFTDPFGHRWEVQCRI